MNEVSDHVFDEITIYGIPVGLCGVVMLMILVAGVKSCFNLSMLNFQPSSN